MDSSKTLKEKLSKDRKPSNSSINKDSKISVYCITAFHSDIKNNNLFSLKAKNSEVSLINLVCEDSLSYYREYEIKIYEVSINKKIKKLNLYIYNEQTKKSFELLEQKIKAEKEMVILDILTMDNYVMNDFMNQLDPKIKEKNIEIIKNLKKSEVFNIFLKFFNKRPYSRDLKMALARQYLSSLKDKEEVIFSDIINIFNISYGTKIITNFLDIYPKLDILFDQLLDNKEFEKILTLYLENKNTFLSKNHVFFIQPKEEKNNNKKNVNKNDNAIIENYRNLLENFMTLYQLICKDEKDIETQRLINLKPIFINLIENKGDILKIMKFFIYIFRAAYIIFTIDNSKRYVLKPIFDQQIPQIAFEEFEGTYELIIKNEKSNKRFIFDFSQAFNYFIDNLKTLEQIVSLKKIYKDELAMYSNYYFEEKARILIHNLGIQRIKTGTYSNIHILNFLIIDDIYAKKEFSNKTELKTFDILNYLNIELMDDEFFLKYNKYEIYNYFSENYTKFLKSFTSLNKIKYFGLFFKLLPAEKYNKDAASYLVDWLEKSINTYDEEECPYFENEIDILFSILNEKSKSQYLVNLIKILEKNLGKKCINIFISFLNKYCQNLKEKEAELMIKFIILTDEEIEEKETINYNNLYTFLDEIKPNKLIAKIFLNKTSKLAINENDFFSENNIKFHIFERLLKSKDYTLLKKSDNKNCHYWINTRHTCNTIMENLKSFNYSYMKIKIFFNIIIQDEVISRINSVFKCLEIEDAESKALSIRANFDTIMEAWKRKIKITEKIKEFYSFSEVSTKIIDELTLYCIKINKSSLQYLNSKEASEEFQNFSKDKNTADIVSTLRDSTIFLNIFTDTKNRYSHSTSKIDTAIERFNHLKKIFVNDRKKIEIEIKNNEEVKFLINFGYKNKEGLEIQIDWLIEYFKLFTFEEKEFLLGKIKSIVTNKSIISMISGILTLFDIYKDILDLTNQEDISLHDKLESYQKKLSINKDLSMKEIEEIKMNIQNQFDLSEESSKKFMEFLIGVNQYPESIKFIKDKKSEDVSNLTQFLLESENVLTEADINDFINVVKYFEETIQALKGQYDIFTKFIKKLISIINEDPKLSSSIFNYIEKSNHIQTLFNDYLKHSEGCIKKIEKILDFSNFNIIKKEEDSYSLEGTFNDQKKDNTINGIYQNDSNSIYMAQNFQYAFYSDLESLFQRVYISKIPQKYEVCAEIYITFFKNCRKLLNLFNEFYSKGYQENFQIEFNFKDKILSCKYKKEIIDINSLIKRFESLNELLEKYLISFYSNKEIIRFFYGRQLSFLFNNIIKKNYNKLLDFLKSIFGPISEDFTLVNLNANLRDYEEVNKFTESISIVFSFIKKQFDYNKKDINTVFDLNKINIIKANDDSCSADCASNTPNQTNTQKKEYKGIFFHLSNDNQEMDALNLYVTMTNHFPINGTFLYCSKDLNLEEMKCFFLRFIYCKENVLFCMVNINSLNSNLRVQFISLIKQYSVKYEKNLKSCLVLIFNGKDDELHKTLMKIKNIKLFPEDSFFEMKYDFSNYFKYNDYVVKSSSCGLGKSQFIKSKNQEQAGSKKKQQIKYIYFPIGGKFSKKNLVDRLINLPDMTNLNEKFVIHLDISQTNEIELLNEFFFKLIIFRKCELNESAKYFGNNITIIIEIPNDFIDYITEIKILSKLKTENLEAISNIDSSNELLTVTKILNMYETDEIIKKQKSELKKIKLNLTQEQISNKILGYLKDMEITNPNYYQINIFIKVLYDEFIKFYNCRGYSVETLNNNATASKMNKDNTLKLLNLRKFIILSLIKVTKLFLVGPYENLIKNQELNQKILNEANEGKEKEKLINEELNIKIDSVSFDEIKPSLIVFNEDGDSCTVITTCSEKDEEFKDLERLYNTQNAEFISSKYRTKSLGNINYKKLQRFRDLSRQEILDSLLGFLNVAFNDDDRKKILGTYVYTPDNFIKVVLILMRIRARIPVILMGETGCGKTTLIEMASKLINKGQIKILKMNIHAGVNDQDIIKFMDDVEARVKAEDARLLKAKKDEFNSLPEEYKKAYLKKNSKEKIYSEYENEIKSRKIWIFFDEINTCNSMGLFIEIFCKNSIYGKPLDDRYVYIAACNPYRVSANENKLLNVLYKKNQKKKSLVYTVNPLPMSLLNFVFNFGSLKEKDEKTYIQSMIEGVTNEIFETIENKEILKKKNDFLNMQTECVQICQNHMKNNNDVSIVSLREVNRFNLFFQFFAYYLYHRKNSKNSPIEENELISLYKEKNELEVLIDAVNLSLFICYYLRLPDKISKEELSKKLNANKYFSEGDFLKVPQMEQDYLLNNFEIPIGIAKNNNLKENIFLIFFCIINKIPVIVCGKPGKSKTLSFEIIQDSMKGPSSRSEFCRQYPALTAFKIQGSLNTTSDEILNIFIKARDYQLKNSDKLSVVFMDEMGLAEIGENNALKVMHSELEQEINKVSFVGISNWFIDASKMNRVVYNVVQDEDKEDLIQTGKEIAKSYEKKEANFNSQKYETIILRLSEAYYKYISKKQEANDINNQFFHGSRDFYSLIKSVMLDIIKNRKILYEYNIKEEEGKTDKLLNEICLNHILRNFGGLENSIIEFKNYFFEGYEEMDTLANKNNNNHSYNFFKCIQDNINDINSRYLLLINNGNLSQELLNYILEDIIETKKKMNQGNVTKNSEKEGIEFFGGEKSEKKERFIKYYMGSKFKADINNIIYSNEILNKIKIQMETDNILILKDLESVYPSLYELFNQSYIYLNNKKFVHLGESKSLSLVNNEFKAIVLVEKDKVKYQEPPFLNRFEKHIINLSFLLNEELLELSKEIYDILNEITNLNNYEHKDTDKDINNIEKKVKKYNNFIKEEEIQGLVYIGSKQIGYTATVNDETKKINKSLIIKFVLDRIVPSFSEELMVIISKFGFKKKYNSYYKLIYECYKNNYFYNFNNFLEKSRNEISIIYTFSPIFDDLIIDSNSSNLDFSKNRTTEINISTITSIDQIDKEISDFIFDFNDSNNTKEKNASKNLLIIKFREEDMNKLNNVYYLIDDYKSNTRNKNLNLSSKKIVFIVYLKRINKIKNYISFLSNCPQNMINNLNNNYVNFTDVIINSNKEIIKKNLFDIDFMICNNINNVVRYFDYKISNLEQNQINEYKSNFIKNTSNSKYIKNIIKECLANLANNEEDFLIKILKEETNTKISELENNFSHKLENHVSNLVFENLRKIIVILEKEQIINSIITNERLCEIDLIKKYIYEFVANINNEQNKKFNWKNKNLNQKVNMAVLYEQKLPFCQKIFTSLFNYIQNNISVKFLEKDSYFLTTIIRAQDARQEEKEYFKAMKKLDDNLKLEVYKYDIIINILNSNNEELIINFFEDCFYAFIKRNDKFKSKFKNLSQILNLLIQLRLKTRINNKLSISFLENEKIDLYNSFIDLVREEWKTDEYEDQEEEKLFKKEINKNSIYFNIFINVMIFLQSYSSEIYIILELYYFLLEYNLSIYDDIVSMITQKKVSMEDSKRNEYYNKINKFSFFYILESLSKILKEKLYELISEKTNNDSSKKMAFFRNVQYLLQNMLLFDKRFLLFSKEIFSLDIIMKIITQIQIKDKDHSFLYFSIDSLTIFLTKTDRSNLIQNLKEQNLRLIKIFGDNINEYSQIMNKILFNYYKSVYDEEIREKIVKEILLEDSIHYHKELLEYCYPLMKLIFKFHLIDIPLTSDNKSKTYFQSNFNDPNPIKSIINNKNDIQINDVLFYRFELICDKYFKKILKENKDDKLKYQKLCGGTSKIYLKEAIEIYYNQTNVSSVELKNIYKIYCLAYIKVYLKYYVDILLDKKAYQHFSERTEVNNILLAPKVKQKEVVNYYILKLILKKMKDWENFVKYYNSVINEANDIYGFNQNQSILKLEQNELFIKSPFLMHVFKIRENVEYTQFLTNLDFDGFNKNVFEKLFIALKRYNFLYTFLVNNSILFYSYKNKDKKDNSMNLIKNVMNYLNIEKKVDKEILTFFNTFFDHKFLSEKVFPKMSMDESGISEEEKLSKIKILYYSLLFVISILLSPKSKTKTPEHLYQNLISKHISTYLDSNYLPGNFQYTNIRIQSYHEIKEILKKNNPKKIGTYLCPCGQYYILDKCTYPKRILQCEKCRKAIGGEKFNMIKREGHIRIFLDEENRQDIMKKHKDAYMPYMLLEEFEKEINKLKKDVFKGIQIKDIERDTFLIRDESVREMNELSYRFLNFVLYSFIFYGIIMGYIKEYKEDDKYTNKYVINNMTCFNMLEKNWEIMESIIDKKPVELFINLIFDDVIEKLSSCPKLNTKEEQIKFEKEINDIIINKNKDLNNIQNLKILNDSVTDLKPMSSKAILQEVFPYTNYLEQDFPSFKFFYLTEFPSQEHFIHDFNSKSKNKDKYPILNSIINGDTIHDHIKLMKYLPLINKLCNYMINFVSFKYSREEAKASLVSKEINDQEIINLMINEFIPAYEIIRPYIRQEGCHEFGNNYMKIDPNKVVLSDLCVDSGEMGFGLVLFAMYKEMATWQNNFINEVINSENIQLKNYKYLFNSKIMIQDCTEEQILDLPSFNDNIVLRNDKNSTLFEMIVGNSHRKDSEIIYNYDEIEDELAAFILPKIKSFKSEFRKVVYQYELFVGEKSSIILNFIEKYQQRDLTELELNSVISYIVVNQNNKKIDMKNFLSSLQVLIDIILNESPSADEPLYSILKQKDNENENIPFADLDKNFFENVLNSIKKMKNYDNNNEINNNDNNENYLTVNCLINLYEIVEFFCWENIRNNLLKKYLDNIDENGKMQFDVIFNKNQEEENNALTITKIEFCSAIRKFISRYLSGKSDETINPDNNLKSYIINEEFWPNDLADVDIETDINTIFGNVNIPISQSLSLYDYLGGDSQKLDEIKIKYMQNAEYYKNLKKIKNMEDRVSVRFERNENLNDIKEEREEKGPEMNLENNLDFATNDEDNNQEEREPSEENNTEQDNESDSDSGNNKKPKTIDYFD